MQWLSAKKLSIILPINLILIVDDIRDMNNPINANIPVQAIIMKKTKILISSNIKPMIFAPPM